MHSGKKVRTGKRLLPQLCDALDLPPESVPGSGVLTLVGARRAVIHGCLSVLLCAGDEISLRVPEGRITLRGESLCVQSFIREQITVCGRIETVHMTEGET